MARFTNGSGVRLILSYSFQNLRIRDGLVDELAQLNDFFVLLDAGSVHRANEPRLKSFLDFL